MTLAVKDARKWTGGGADRYVSGDACGVNVLRQPVGASQVVVDGLQSAGTAGSAKVVDIPTRIQADLNEVYAVGNRGEVSNVGRRVVLNRYVAAIGDERGADKCQVGPVVVGAGDRTRHALPDVDRTCSLATGGDVAFDRQLAAYRDGDAGAEVTARQPTLSAIRVHRPHMTGA